MYDNHRFEADSNFMSRSFAMVIFFFRSSSLIYFSLYGLETCCCSSFPSRYVYIIQNPSAFRHKVPILSLTCSPMITQDLQPNDKCKLLQRTTKTVESSMKLFYMSDNVPTVRNHVTACMCTI